MQASRALLPKLRKLSKAYWHLPQKGRQLSQKLLHFGQNLTVTVSQTQLLPLHCRLLPGQQAFRCLQIVQQILQCLRQPAHCQLRLVGMQSLPKLQQRGQGSLGNRINFRQLSRRKIPCGALKVASLPPHIIFQAATQGVILQPVSLLQAQRSQAGF